MIRMAITATVKMPDNPSTLSSSALLRCPRLMAGQGCASERDQFTFVLVSHAQYAYTHDPYNRSCIARGIRCALRATRLLRRGFRRCDRSQPSLLLWLEWPQQPLLSRAR